MIHVIATIQVSPGKREDFLAAFAELVPDVRAESGCIEYGPAVEIANAVADQRPVRDDEVTVIEKWDSIDALRMHLDAPHMARYRRTVKDIVLRVTIQVLEPA